MRYRRRGLGSGQRNVESETNCSSPRRLAFSDHNSLFLNVALQFTSNFKRRNTSIAQTVNYVGNNNKSLHLSLEASLKKLRTSYIDLLYVHWWDFETSIEEVMRSLHTLITARKVLYLVRHCLFLAS
jgi:aryl-alcohol dehydrogenase-like predicted oxidoreductase